MDNEKKVTIYDIADAMNVSSGTVYRALHNTGRISQKTRQAVLQKAEEMGYTTNLAAQGLRRNPIYIGCILACSVPPFLHEIRKGINAAFKELSKFRVYPDVMEITDGDDHWDEIGASVDAMLEKGYKGFVFLLSGRDDEFSGIISRIREKGVPIATVVSELPCGDGAVHVATNGICAGQLAAEILHLSCADQPIAILTANQEVSIHKQNIAGFFEYASRHSFSAIDIYEHHDISDRALALIDEVFKKNLYRGIYISSASSIYLYEYQKTHTIPPDVRIVTTDLFEENRALLEMGSVCATIFQDPYQQGRRVVEMLYRCISENADGGTYLLTPQAVFQSNRDLFPPVR